FFKQKTAYEISRDWSSDVCSSDLVRLDGARGGWKIAADSANDIIEDLRRPTVELTRVLRAIAHGDLSQRMPVDPATGSPNGQAEIGRASCRARVQDPAADEAWKQQ